LDDKVAEQGLTRKPATFSIGEATITGDEGAPIPLGTKVASDNAIFSTTAEGVIENGAAVVPIQADAAGAGGNVPSGAINRFPVTIAGLVGVSNSAPTAGGYDIESDIELRERYFEKVSMPATSGNISHYKMWAKEVAGVGEAKIIPTWNGGGTVKVIIVDAENGVASEDLVGRVYAHIESVRPVGATVTVVSAEPKPIDISVKLQLIDTPADAQDEIIAAVSSYLKKIAFANKAVSIAHIGSYILSCPSVADYDDLLINAQTENIPINNDEVAVIGNVVVT
jgi:uncharacterized phage protein gp47/JayE